MHLQREISPMTVLLIANHGQNVQCSLTLLEVVIYADSGLWLEMMLLL